MIGEARVDMMDLRLAQKKRLAKRGEAGQAAVEFALIVVFLVVFLISFQELVTLLYT